MNATGRLAYEAAYRRAALVLVVVLPALACGAAALAGVFLFISDTDTILRAVLGIAGGTIMASAGALLTTLRVHRWDVAADGLRIEERPQIPLTRRRMRAVVPFADIVALRRVEKRHGGSAGTGRAERGGLSLGAGDAGRWTGSTLGSRRSWAGSIRGGDP